MTRSVGGGRLLSGQKRPYPCTGEKASASVGGAISSRPADRSSVTTVLAGASALNSEGEMAFLQPALSTLASPVRPARLAAWQQQRPCFLAWEAGAAPSGCE